MKKINNLNYREWQKRNTNYWQNLSKSQQKEARQKGYHNIGWKNVQKSWLILQKLPQKVISIFDHKLEKGDLIGAIDLAIMTSEKTSEIAQKTLQTLKKNQHRLNKLAKKTLSKYKPL
jgi:hypothetical protein